MPRAATGSHALDLALDFTLVAARGREPKVLSESNGQERLGARSQGVVLDVVVVLVLGERD
jgi:hypothetical protein